MKTLSFTGLALATLSTLSVARGIPWLDSDIEQVTLGAGVESTYEFYSHDAFPSHQLRLKSPKLCDPTVVQHSGYLDVSEEKHIFFWFFEARSNPSTAPVVIWLNGGPGCSSTTGLFFALGPCSIQNNGSSTAWNKWSWNNNANMLFIDQPAGVGYSYNTGTTIDNSFIAADDMWAFLQLFYKRFPQYNGELHVAGESYAGTYVPHIASAIYKHNQELSRSFVAEQHVNLSTIIMGNGLTNPYYQFGSLYDWYCDGKWKIIDKNGPHCERLKKAVGICQRMLQICEDFDTSSTCGPAGAFCFKEVFGSTLSAHLNPYDARMKCNYDDASADECYREIPWISAYLNTPHVKAELGIPSKNNFTACNLDIHEKFVSSGDAARSSAELLPELIESGLRVLVYAGDADLLCPGMSQTPWMENLKTSFQQKFIDAPIVPLRTHNRTAGSVRSTGGDNEAGRIALVEIYDAGHMAPHDQPDASLDMFNRWLQNKPLKG